jgi:hypothetical protein
MIFIWAFAIIWALTVEVMIYMGWDVKIAPRVKRAARYMYRRLYAKNNFRISLRRSYQSAENKLVHN